MKDAKYISTPDIKTSSTKRGLRPVDVRPGGDLWTSEKYDKKPRIDITLGDNAVLTQSVKIINARNVKKVKVIFLLANKKTVTKVRL